MRRRSVDDVMREFHMNGSDSPYNPDDDNIWAMRAGQSFLYLLIVILGGKAGLTRVTIVRRIVFGISA